jgi:hypothetical protein
VIEYRPPAGLLGRVAEMLGTDKVCERQLRRGLEHLAQDIERKPKRIDPERAPVTSVLARSNEVPYA